MEGAFAQRSPLMTASIFAGVLRMATVMRMSALACDASRLRGTDDGITGNKIDR